MSQTFEEYLIEWHKTELCEPTGKTIWQAAQQAAAPKWISVHDRLPVYDHDVAVLFDKYGVYVGRWVDGHWVLCGHNEPAFQEITHWMPLPDAPKEKAE